MPSLTWQRPRRTKLVREQVRLAELFHAQPVVKPNLC